MTAREEIEKLLSKLRSPAPNSPVGSCAGCFIYRQLMASKNLNLEAAKMIEELLTERKNDEG